MDIKNKQQRSHNMSKIKSKDTQPEIYFRKLLFHQGIRYYKNYPQLYGKPDLFLSKYRTAIFVHGCFWHRHKDCRFATSPSSNVEKWEEKFTANIKRDEQVQEQLMQEGYRVGIVWECTIRKMQKDPQFRESILVKIMDFLADGQQLRIEL